MSDKKLALPETFESQLGEPQNVACDEMASCTCSQNQIISKCEV